MTRLITAPYHFLFAVYPILSLYVGLAVAFATLLATGHLVMRLSALGLWWAVGVWQTATATTPKAVLRSGMAVPR